jgi:hypothetical protein
MKAKVFAARAGRLLPVPVTLAALLFGCQVGPPRASENAREGVVRASDPFVAVNVARDLDDLLPRVLALLPDTRRSPLEVWVQETPALYAFKTSAYSDADGFFAEGAQRIHLRAGSDNLERTLAHELVHATLGPSWRTLPGTLEEGLCDVVSARLCPDAAARLAAGRLSSAAFATGGLVLDVELQMPTPDHNDASEACWSARLRLDGEPRLRIDPLLAFDVHAGLSTSNLPAEEKKACYGLAFVVVQRIVERSGFEGLHDLCAKAGAAGLETVPVAALLDAAGIDGSVQSFHDAIDAAFGPDELHELVRSHPEFLVTTVARYVGPMTPSEAGDDALARLSARVSVADVPQSTILVRSLTRLRPRLDALVALSRLELAGR